MGNNDSIITVMIVDNDLVIISNNDVITYVIMSSNHVITDIIMSNNPCLRPSLPQAFDSLSSLQVRHSLYPRWAAGSAAHIVGSGQLWLSILVSDAWLTNLLHSLCPRCAAGSAAQCPQCRLRPTVTVQCPSLPLVLDALRVTSLLVRHSLSPRCTVGSAASSVQANCDGPSLPLVPLRLAARPRGRRSTCRS